jgi:hypothetical protein
MFPSISAIGLVSLETGRLGMMKLNKARWWLSIVGN